MSHQEKTVLLVAALLGFVASTTLVVAALIHNIDDFCANPDAPGNWLVSPYCNM